MLEALATGLGPHAGRLEYIGRIEDPQGVLPPGGPVARALDVLDIILAHSLAALFAAAKR